ncbi:MAG TPA: hypothetical protein DCP12_03905 [Rhodobiaceae bacterium]|nr:hypothetical protein [Rhodobiaceae bacterium]
MTRDENDPPSALTTREKRAFFDLNLTGEMTFSQRRQLAPPLVLFYLSAAALIILSYFSTSISSPSSPSCTALRPIWRGRNF